MFKVGDKVRIHDQKHPYCGFYGTVLKVEGELLTIGAVSMIEAFQSQVEAA